MVAPSNRLDGNSLRRYYHIAGLNDDPFKGTGLEGMIPTESPIKIGFLDALSLGRFGRCPDTWQGAGICAATVEIINPERKKKYFQLWGKDAEALYQRRIAVPIRFNLTFHLADESCKIDACRIAEACMIRSDDPVLDETHQALAEYFSRRVGLRATRDEFEDCARSLHIETEHRGKIFELMLQDIYDHMKTDEDILHAIRSGFRKERETPVINATGAYALN